MLSNQITDPAVETWSDSSGPSHAAAVLCEGTFAAENSAGAGGELEFAFHGRHFVASYCDCDSEALLNVPAFMKAFRSAVEASGATILSGTQHTFEGGGFTALLLLSESHASVHTYPEHRACFVDLFTCGNSCSAEAFDRVLRSYLRPGRHSEQYLVRNEATQPEALQE